MQGHHALSERQIDFVVSSEDHSLSALIRHFNGGVVTTHHDVLRRTHNRLTIRRSKDVIRTQHQGVCFDLCFDRQRQVNCHLVSVEVSVEALTNQRMQVNRVALHQGWLKCLNPHSVQGWCTIEQHGVIGDHLFENVPNLFVFSLQHLLGRLDGIGMTEFLESTNDEWLVEFQSNLFGKTTLMDLQSGTDHDYATCGVVNTLSE